MSIRMANVAEHAHDAALLRPPWKNGERGRVREQKKVGFFHLQEAANGGSIERNAVGKRARLLFCHDGDVF